MESRSQQSSSPPPEEDDTPPRRRRGRLLATLLALPLGLVLTDLAVGYFYLGSADYAGPPLPPFTVRDNPHLQSWFSIEQEARSNGKLARTDLHFDGDLGWTNHARAERRGKRSYVSGINSIGARGSREYSPTVPAGRVRLTCFGDSFTFGSEVEDHQTWCAQVEQLDPTLEAVNFGVAGYGVDQALLRHRRKSAELESHVVVIGIQIEALPRIVTRCRSIENPRASVLCVKPRFFVKGGDLQLLPLPIEDGDHLYRLASGGRLPQLLARREYWGGDEPALPFSSIARLHAAYEAHARRDYRALWEASEEEPFQLMMRLLLAFRQEALTAGAEEVVVLLFPNHNDLKFRGRNGSRFLKTFRHKLKGKHFEVLDFDQRFHSLMTKDRSAMFLRHHFNPQANGMVAEALVEWVGSRSKLWEDEISSTPK